MLASPAVQAIILSEHGDVTQLVPAEVPTPTPSPGEVLVRVEAVAMNHLDIWVREGLPGLKLSLPHILGSDIAGEVVGTGQKVVVNPGVSCLRCRECLSGRDNFCREYKILGEHINGGYAQFVSVPTANLVSRPSSLSAVEAAALPLTMLTAWQMLVLRAQVRPGETVLVMAVGSGVSSAAVQIAKLFGARVIATSTSDEKLDRARSLGADETINTSKVDLVEAVRQLTGKRGADVVVEHIGQALWQKLLQACCKGGRIVTCGATTGYQAETDLRHIFYRQISILGSTMGPKGALFEILDHVRAGRLIPVVDCVMPLANARQAHERLASRGQFGKIVLEVH